VQRHVTKVALSEDEIARADFMTRIIPWHRLEWLKLRYFGTRRERRQDNEGHPTGGFWQLTLKGADGRMIDVHGYPAVTVGGRPEAACSACRPPRAPSS